MTNIQLLRLMFIISSAGFAVYYYGFMSDPLWLDVVSELAFVAVNIFMMVYLVWLNSRVRFDQREQFLYETEFSSLTKVEFSKLLKISEWCLDGPDHVYTVEGQDVEFVFYLVSGHVEAALPDGNKVNMGPGNVIGEVSYRLEGPASATVTSTESSLSLRWEQSELRKLCIKIDNIKLVVDSVLSSHMARKLIDSQIKD
ncbi:MAG: CRP-like cAMP-binding protein [Gammaproteobacteria bacterium]|jgi:CRP-like cAMP-binding protein